SGAAHHEQARERGRTRHTRQALERAQSITARAGDAIDLATLDRPPRHFARRAFAFDDDLDARRLRAHAIDDLGGLADDDLLVARDFPEPGRRDANAVAAGRRLVEAKPPFGVRRDAELAP